MRKTDSYCSIRALFHATALPRRWRSSCLTSDRLRAHDLLQKQLLIRMVTALPHHRHQAQIFRWGLGQTLRRQPLPTEYRSARAHPLSLLVTRNCKRKYLTARVLVIGLVCRGAISTANFLIIRDITGAVAVNNGQQLTVNYDFTTTI